jgi:hypothetical protein
MGAAEAGNKERLDAATTLGKSRSLRTSKRITHLFIPAHTQIGNMRLGLTKYNNGEEKATALFEAAYGTNADATRVNEVVTALETGTIKAKVTTHPFRDNQIADITWTMTEDGWKPGNIKFSKQFHGTYISC